MFHLIIGNGTCIVWFFFPPRTFSTTARWSYGRRRKSERGGSDLCGSSVGQYAIWALAMPHGPLLSEKLKERKRLVLGLVDADLSDERHNSRREIHNTPAPFGRTGREHKLLHPSIPEAKRYEDFSECSKNTKITCWRSWRTCIAFGLIH